HAMASLRSWSPRRARGSRVAVRAAGATRAADHRAARRPRRRRLPSEDAAAAAGMARARGGRLRRCARVAARRDPGGGRPGRVRGGSWREVVRAEHPALSLFEVPEGGRRADDLALLLAHVDQAVEGTLASDDAELDGEPVPADRAGGEPADAPITGYQFEDLT